MTIRYIPEIIIEGKRLGRHVDHDERSLAYALPEADTIVSVQWPRVIPVLNQGNVGSCHDADTEILTSRGWLPFPDLTLENELATVDPTTGDLIYERPVRVIDLEYSGDIYTVKNSSKDFRVTPDHMMLVRKWDEAARTLTDSYTLTPMKDVGWYSGLMATVNYAGVTHDGNYTIQGIPNYKHAGAREDLIVPMRAWLNFLGIYLAEGTMLQPTSKSPNKIQIAAFKDREKTFVRRVFADLGIHALELRDRFTFENARVYRHLESLGLKGIYAAEKFVPEFVFDLPAGDIQALLEGHREGDGAFQDGTWTHYTSSPRLADDIQRLIFLSGGKTGVSTRAPRTSTMKDGRVVIGKHNEIAVRHLKGSLSSLERKNDVTVEQYDGRVYCAEVPTHHTLVTRRNGKILIAGNCTGNACIGILGTNPDDGDLAALIAAGLVLDEVEALTLYSAAEVIDGNGPYPPNDNGSSGLSVAKAAKARGLCSGFTHALSVAGAHTAIQSGPFMVGSDWYNSFDTPDANGVVAIAEGATVRGGHEYECVGYDLPSDLWHLVNSWGTAYGVAGHFYYSTATFTALLASSGDVTSLVPLSQPAPLPSPVPTLGGAVAPTAVPSSTPAASSDVSGVVIPPNAPEGFLDRIEDDVEGAIQGAREWADHEANKLHGLMKLLHTALGQAIEREAYSFILQGLRDGIAQL